MNLAMSELINQDQKHMLWQDEIRHDFLLTKWCEIYRFSTKKITVLTWSKQMFLKCLKAMDCEDYLTDEKGKPTGMDDNTYRFTTSNSNLGSILALGATFFQRPHLKGKWILDKQEKLGHKIRKYRPQRFE